MATSTTNETTSEPTKSEREAEVLARLVSDALTVGISQFSTTFQGELAAFRECEENRFARLERAIADLKPTPINPTEHFWSVYKKTVDERFSRLSEKYKGTLDVITLWSGLLLAVVTTCIVQSFQLIQPNPADLTNVLLLRILQQNTSFDGADPLTPVNHYSTVNVRIAQELLFFSLIFLLFVVFAVMPAKEVIYPHTWDSARVGDDGGRRLKLWFLQLGDEEVFKKPKGLGRMVLVAFASLGVAVAILLSEIFGWTMSAVIAYPFLLPLFMLPGVGVALLPRLRHILGRSETWLKNAVYAPWSDPPYVGERLTEIDIWRKNPLFTSLPPEDNTSSAGAWLLENDTDFSAAAAFVAMFSELQWPFKRPCTIALIRLREAYEQCFQTSKFDDSTRLKALQSAAAYYVIYHTQLIREALRTPACGEKLPTDLPLDLFIHERTGEWGGEGVFEYLLHLEDRSEPVTSARFLSYIAPYWFCGDSDSGIQSRPRRLEKMYKLVDALEKSQAFTPATLANCVLCVGATMDFPLHAEDLVRVDKSEYLWLILREVVEHTANIASADGPRRPFAATALEILLTLVMKATIADVACMTELLKGTATEKVDRGTFTLLLAFNGWMKEEDVEVDTEPPLIQAHVQVPGSAGTEASETRTPEYTLFDTIAKRVKACSVRLGRMQHHAVYGGLVAIKDIPRLGSCLPEVGFLEMLSDATEENKDLRLRKAAYGVIRAAQGGWLRSADLRQTLQRLDLPRKLHSVVVETGRADHRRSFLTMMETLAEDRCWHSYLRRTMDIWLPFHGTESPQVLHIFTAVAGVRLPEGPSDLPLDEILTNLIRDEWDTIPGRSVQGLAVDRLKPLVEVTQGLIKQLLFDEADRRVVLAAVKQAIPYLEKQCGTGYHDLGDDVREIIGGLVKTS